MTTCSCIDRHVCPGRDAAIIGVAASRAAGAEAAVEEGADGWEGSDDDAEADFKTDEDGGVDLVPCELLLVSSD